MDLLNPMQIHSRFTSPCWVSLETFRSIALASSRTKNEFEARAPCDVFETWVYWERVGAESSCGTGGIWESKKLPNTDFPKRNLTCPKCVGRILISRKNAPYPLGVHFEHIFFGPEKCKISVFSPVFLGGPPGNPSCYPPLVGLL